ncbi:hypothetical protein L917_10750, partial [Phytophthora nicotianae]
VFHSASVLPLGPARNAAPSWYYQRFQATATSAMSDRGSPSPRRSRSRSPSPRADDNEDKKSPRVSDNEDRETSRRSRSRSPAPKAPAAPADVANPGNNLYVANLATRVGEQDLQEIFSKFGRVDKCEVIVDPVTKESR